MKKLTISRMFAVVGLLVLGGCAMKEFSSTPLYSGSEVKFTGAVEDRVNLWPLAYWREPVGSIVWPLISWGDDHLALRPVYSQYKQDGSGEYDEFNFLWPVSQFDTRDNDYRVFPFFWGKSHGSSPYFTLFPALWWNREFSGVFPFFWSDNGDGFCVFPLVWHSANGSNSLDTVFPLYYYRSFSGGSSFWALCGLAGCNSRERELAKHYFLPFYLWNRGEFYSLPYSCYRSDGIVKSRVLCSLAGVDSSEKGEYRASWLFPLYYHDDDLALTPIFGRKGGSHWVLPFYYRSEKSFVTSLFGWSGDADWAVPFYWRDNRTFASLPYWRHLGSDGEIDAAFSLPLLSGYERDHKSGDRLLYLLMGLGGHVWNDETGGASWAFPLYYSDRESFYTLLYGHNPRRTWLFPVYFGGEDRTYITPLYGRNRKDGSDWLVPLYYRNKESFITPFYGRSGTCSWMLPLYLREKERSFYSLPYGWSGGGSSNTNTYFAAGLAGLKSGRKEGGWMFPLFNYKKDSDFDEKESWLDEAKLPESVKVWTEIETNKVWNSTKKTYESVVEPKPHATYVSASNTKTHLLVFDNDKSLFGWAPCGVTNCYELTAKHKLGNKLVFNHESNREVCFDTTTREKISDSEEGDTSLLMFLYNGEHRSDKAKGTSYTSHRVLWKLWDWEEENGDVALDVFPGFTYDSKTNGYSKTSFLWRFFRYENDPEKGKKVDLLFIPVWR